MRIGVIRGDLSGPIFLADLEPTSQTDFPVEPAGSTRYLSRPDSTVGASALALVPATIASTGDITFPLTVNGSNNVLKLRILSTGLYTTVTIASATYANITTLLAAINAALVTAAISAHASTSIGLSSTLRIALSTTASFGPGATIGIDSTGNGSIANASLGLGTAARAVTVPTVASMVAAFLPVGGPLDVSQATILSTVGYGLSLVQVKAIADAIAPQFVESNVAIQSLKKGNLAGFLSASFNPDVYRLPAISAGAAITVVHDDGSTVFSTGLPVITSAAINTPNTGDVTITGTNLGNAEQELVTVKFTGLVHKSIVQKVLETTNTGGTQGSVSATSIVIPASLIPGAAAATTSVQVKYDSFASGITLLT